MNIPKKEFIKLIKGLERFYKQGRILDIQYRPKSVEYINDFRVTQYFSLAQTDIILTITDIKVKYGSNNSRKRNRKTTKNRRAARGVRKAKRRS